MTIETKITRKKKLPGSNVDQFNVERNGFPFGAIIRNGRGSVWLCAPLNGETTQHATLDEAKVQMMDLLLA